MSWNVFQNNTSLEIGVFSASGSFALLALLCTAYLIFRHLKHWHDPEAQKAIVRILLMVPFYAVISWLAILWGTYSLYFELVRDCYEAYVLYQFFCLLVHYCVKEKWPDQVGQILIDSSLFTYGFDSQQLPFPLCRITYRPSAATFLAMKRCSLQYVILKPTLSAVAILLHFLGLYHPGEFNPRYGFLWLTILLNISAMLAFYSIVTFYEMIADTISMYAPLLKLISIKILIFFVFWQDVVVSLLYYMQWIPAFFGWSSDRSAATMQNILICVEMLALALFNLKAFSYIDYRTEQGENTLEFALENLTTVASQKDVISDAKDALHPKHLKHSIQRRLGINRNSSDSEEARVS